MKQLNVLYLTDNNYATYAGVSITSMFINNKTVDKFVVYIIDDNISSDNKEKLIELGNQYNHEIVFLDLTEGIKILKSVGAPTYRNSYTTYLKLFTFNILPEDVHQIFFIDSDTIIVDDLGEMVDYDMQNHMIGAVKDGITHPYKIALGYPSSDSWYNMGVMLVDVDMWKKDNAQDKIVEQLKKRNSYIAVDQDLLNITQHGNIIPLHPKYNATAHHYVYPAKTFLKAFKQEGFYDEKTIDEGQKMAIIRHFERFVGESAWNKNTAHPYAKLFDKYLEKSLWNDYEKKKAKLSPVLKVENILYRILPKRIFCYIYAFAFKKFLLKNNKKYAFNANVKNIK